MNSNIIQPAVWLDARCISHQVIPMELRDFLLDPGSTTRRMQREYAAQTKVNILKQGWYIPHYQEAQLLNIPLRHTALIRETYLSCQNKIWMYAKAIFPKDFFTGKNQRIQHELDHRPLGKLIFRDPTMQRSKFELALITPNHQEYHWATQNLTKIFPTLSTNSTRVPDEISTRGVARRGGFIFCDQAKYGVPQRQDPETPIAQSGTRSTHTTLWARRSIIHLQKKPLLLIEIFFPTFLELKKAIS